MDNGTKWLSSENDMVVTSDECLNSLKDDQVPAGGSTVTISTHGFHQTRWSRFLDPKYRRNIIKTAFIYWEVLAMGWMNGQMGPTLPDLRQIASASLQQVTWLFTGFSFGYLLGCFKSGLLEKFIRNEMVIGLCAVLCGIAVVLLPQIPSIVAMVMIRVVIGFCIGGIDTGISSVMFKMWGTDVEPFLQMIHVLFAVGGIVSPLVAEPFLMGAYEQDEHIKMNSSAANPPCDLMNLTEPAIITTESMTTCKSHRFTNVQYAYLISGIMMSIAAVPFMLISKQICCNSSNQTTEIQERDKDCKTTNVTNAPANIKMPLICIILMISYLATALFYLFPSLLTTFLMSQLQWTQQTSSTLTTVFFAAYGIGNIINIFSLLFITLTNLILVMYISGIVTLLSFMFSVMANETTLIWTTVPAFGLSFSSFLPTLLAWTNSHVTPVTTRIASSILFSGSLSLILNPLLIGYLMEFHSPMWFVYISCGEAGLCLILFCFSLCLLRTRKMKETKHNTLKTAHL